MSDQATTIPTTQEERAKWLAVPSFCGCTVEIDEDGSPAHHEDCRLCRLTAELDRVLPLLDEMGKALEEMPCWSPYEGSYFSGCDHRVPPEMRHATNSEDERCRRCDALSRFHDLRGQR